MHEHMVDLKLDISTKTPVLLQNCLGAHNTQLQYAENLCSQNMLSASRLFRYRCSYAHCDLGKTDVMDNEQGTSSMQCSSP